VGEGLQWGEEEGEGGREGGRAPRVLYMDYRDVSREDEDEDEEQQQQEDGEGKPSFPPSLPSLPSSLPPSPSCPARRVNHSDTHISQIPKKCIF